MSVTKGLAKGSVDWKKVCEHLTGKAPEDADWANYRRADNFRVTVRVTGRDLPKNMTDEAARADIACAKEPAFNGWF